MRHLSDENIQEYLDSKGLVGGDLVEDHIVICSSCNEKLERYKEIYQELAVEENIELAADFNLVVLDRIESSEKSPNLNWKVTTLGTICVAVLSLLALDLYGIISIATLASTLGGSFLAAWTPLANVFVKVSEFLNGSLKLLVFAAATVLLFHLLEQSLIKGRFKRAPRL